jgi:hypothetical protein
LHLILQKRCFEDEDEKCIALKYEQGKVARFFVLIPENTSATTITTAKE